MGIPMGTYMRFPINGQEDWEDVEFTDMMYMRLMGGDATSDDEFEDVLRSYEARRADGLDVWGIKSPFALPFVENIRAAFSGELKVVLTRRSSIGIHTSLSQQPGDTAHLINVQNKLIPLPRQTKFDLSINITESWNSPDKVRAKLLEMIRS
jgi:hypothetical protein